MNELNTNQRIKPLTVQFVPLKVVTAGQTWGQWASKYPAQGRGIPYLYVIRADGEMLYGQSGSKSGAELAQFMAEHLQQSGRLFNARELELLETALADAKTAIEQQDESAAIEHLAQLSKLGTLGDLKSYSTLAIEADALANEMIAKGTADVEAAAAMLADPATAFDAAMKLAELKQTYARFDAVAQKIAESYRTARENEALKELLSQADLVQRALARRQLRGGEALAVRDLTRVVERFPGTPAADYAATKIAELGGEAPEASEPTASDEYRTWTDATGEHQIEAKLLATKSGWVQLEDKTGKKHALPINRLSAEDQAFLAE